MSGHCCHGEATDHDHTHEEADTGLQDSLFDKVDVDKAWCLNETTSGSIKTIFKPWGERLDTTQRVQSDADEELIIHVPFTGMVKLKSLLVWGGADDSAPASVRLFANRDGLDFDSVEDAEPTQQVELARGLAEPAEYPVRTAKFSSTRSLTLHVTGNFGGEQTTVYFLAFRGEWTRLKEAPKRITYYYDEEVGNYNYGYMHPMKPFRMRMAHSLVSAYRLDRELNVIRPPRASALEMTRFHADDYVEFLSRVTPELADHEPEHASVYLSGEDCPAFDGVFEFCSISAGGSIAGAKRINHGESDIVINWAGGLHHAKKGAASGFCYINDIVLAILELLRVHQRVMYLDIDVHHGDGVEEAFYTTDRVMSVSFHKFGDFFPGTGHVNDVGVARGKGFAVNVPLRDGIDDDSYQGIFRPVMRMVMERFRPGAVVMQCGTDSLSGDRIGCFNLSMKGHAACVEFMKSFNVPLFCLGGGGYTIRNVARTWAYETAVLLGRELDPVLPFNDYYDFYAPEFRLDVPASNMDNANTPEYLDKIRTLIAEQLRDVPHAPSVQTMRVPRDWPEDSDGELDDAELDADAEAKMSRRQRDARIVPHAEAYDSDSDEFTPIVNTYRHAGTATRPAR
ncbi:histone deacetylase (class I) Clr6 [Coemansia sp. RSA 2336]|nr:histone deacetylase (class I) Clr6 [Coemansia sp. RSA 2336]